VFLDYNQNARDRTVASAYSVRPVPDARVSTPLQWDEVPEVEPEAFTLRTVPDRLHSVGDPGADIDDHVGTLESVFELSERQAHEGQGEAPYPPHFPKAEGEPVRAQPSRRRNSIRAKEPAEEGSVPPPAPGKKSGPTGRRRTRMPLIEIARAASEREAMEGFERWKARHPEVVPHLEPTDIMVDPMRGRSTTWTRIRVNLRNVPEGERPAQEALEVDYDPWEGVEWPQESASPQEGGDSPS
jgi:bifunctional non-homologous end joining protein LigD